MRHSRRSFLARLGVAAVGAAVAADVHGLRRSRGGPGVQLYTLRAEMRRDVAATLARVAEAGYREVEFAGYFGHSPAQIAALLAEHELTAPSVHVGLDAVRQHWSRTVDSAAAAGHTWITVPWVAAQDHPAADDWKRLGALFNERGDRARAAGLRFAYHNHDFEFARAPDGIPLEILLNETDPGIVDFQLDVYWATKAGFDPVSLLEQHPGRFRMTHLKDSAGPPEHHMTDVGAGSIDFPRLLDAARAAGVRHHFVEHDQSADPFRSITRSFRYLTALTP